MRVDVQGLRGFSWGTFGSPGAESPREKGSPPEAPVRSKASSYGSLESDWYVLLEIARLRRIDQMVRAHERAHLVAGGNLVRSGPHYVYRRGPDGKLYAVGGDVVLDTSPIPGDPEATLQKAERIIRAALAPIDPSPQDIQVAMRAQMMAMQARLELTRKDTEVRGAENRA